MPETTFLQIQGRDQSASRVLELPLGPVRIGRGSHCEVRLGGEPGLGDVQCLLRRRGTNWHFQPVGPPGHVWIDGRPADQQRPLPVGSSLRVGDHWLTLRSASSPPELRGSFTAPITVEAHTVEEPTEPIVEPSPEILTEPEATTDEERPRPTSNPAEDEDRLRRWQTRLEQRERWLKSRQEERTWEARWKAAGETIRNRGSAAPTRPAQSTPTPAPAPAPLDRRPLARPAERSVEMRAVNPMPRPAENPRPSMPPRVPDRPLTGQLAPQPLQARTRPEPPAIRTYPVFPTTAPAEERPLPEIIEEPTVLEPVAVEEIAEVEIVVEALISEAIEEEEEVVAEQTFSEPIAETLPEPIEVAPEEFIASEPIRIEEPEAFAFEPPVVPQVSITEIEPVAPLTQDRSLLIAEASVVLPEPARPVAARVFEADWPSARSIFDARVSRPATETQASPARGAKNKPGPMPTAAVAPAQWVLPTWLGVIPTAILTLVVGSGGLLLAWFWTKDAMAMNSAVRLALRPENSAPPVVDPASIPHPRWWETSSGQLAAWAVALERSQDGEIRTEEVRSLVEDARHASPLSATSRFQVELPPPADAGPATVKVGRTRDIVSLAWTGRDLSKAGKPESALKAYRTAFDLAAKSEGDKPTFDESRQPRRYTFGHESLLSWVAQQMAQVGPWTHEQWLETMPGFALAPLVTARVLRSQDPAEAERLIELAVTSSQTPAHPGFSAAEHQAAGAEALTVRSRWTDAVEQYRRAIDLSNDDTTKRRWWINLAEIAGRSGDESVRGEALDQAIVAGDSPDEITRRAQKLKNMAGLGRTVARP